MTTLQVRTREGRMYSIDTRLRPSGNQGALVSSLESFARYHAESAQLWERQAMIKARGVAGEAALRDEVEAIVERFVYARSLRDDEVAEIHRLRMRLEHELAGDERAEFNVKTGRGGLLDIEFMVQMKQLRHGSGRAGGRRRATRHALAALASAGRGRRRRRRPRSSRAMRSSARSPIACASSAISPSSRSSGKGIACRRSHVASAMSDPMTQWPVSCSPTTGGIANASAPSMCAGSASRPEPPTKP